MSHKTRAQQIASFKIRLAAYLKKEARCPKCIKTAKEVEAEGSTESKLCYYHQEARKELVWG